MGLSRPQFAQLVREYSEMLYRVAYRLTGERQTAEDLVQETFRSAWSSRDRFQAGLSDRAWLITILRRRAADRHRRRTLPIILCEDSLHSTPTFDPDPADQELSDEMQTALSQLVPEIRETLLLVVVGELTHQEAAQVLQVPIGTVLSRVSRGRKKLREYLSPQIANLWEEASS
ncbi:RNA polymerase sigma factor SigE [Planctomycetales bacterium 10988]|nr:RNA polymerase sigma factor SigE [Planctomycetales bacterium 10988]